ncbi:MAG: glycosyltransferase family 2 protein [Acidobacteria bacterium]|nr:glycosyltransferase family 2 protein [Acidobacteriota bacterium]MCA1609790.1 glycosyltransferase family 2 protein [Acidobacteriota bacterium]
MERLDRDQPGRTALTYILPIRSEEPQQDGDLGEYLRWLAVRAETIVVDGSPEDVFAAHDRSWGAFVRHVRPAPDLVTPMGKVGGVLTGVRLATHDRLVIADDDVRYDAESLEKVARALETADVVRPQNFFEPLPWHAHWDTGRMLLNRMMGGDWPGTLGVRRSILEATGGYDGSVMFENLELVRTVLAAGGREAVLLDAYVLRRPSTTAHFWSQRVRQAYDEFARPARLAAQLGVLPAVLALVLTRHGRAAAGLAAAAVGVAELGRRRAGGRRVFPWTASLFAPVWLAERAICSWLAVGAHAFLGGVPYRGGVLRHAATPMRALRERFRPEALSPAQAGGSRRQSA